ncbi:MAG: helicase-related protein [Chitinophagaceae bacterium]
MSWNYSLLPEIDLHVTGRIQQEDADRQTLTAKALLERLHYEPGQILADEVGMGKTFVALAAAVSVALQDKETRPVVVMMPSGLKEKWPKDLGVFVEKCLPEDFRKKVRFGRAENNVEFLKLLDDAPSVRNNIIFLTHTALTRNLTDNWLKLAIIQRALYRRRDTEQIYKSLVKFGPNILLFQHLQRMEYSIIEKLMNHSPADWKKILVKSKLWDNKTDDPVPEQITSILNQMPSSEFDEVFNLLKALPSRESSGLKDRVKVFRQELNNALVPIWTSCLSKLNHSLPLLIMDEAHHLKNSKTQIAKLFQDNLDDDAINAGQLHNVFERMIFLTATPFQLGHQELCNILDRFKGISWESSPELNPRVYTNNIESLRKVLDKTQESAIRFDRAWGNLSASDLIINEIHYDEIENWWDQIETAVPDQLNLQQLSVVERFRELEKKMKHAEHELRKYLIRHLKKKELTGEFRGVERRAVYPGRSILASTNGQTGLPVEDSALLPFLLSARLSSLNPNARPVFAEGLASSYEAFMFTRKKDWEVEPTDIDEEYELKRPEDDKESEWYLNEIHSLVGRVTDNIIHPKVYATVKKVIELWEKGEKVLVFCHYLETSRALWIAISRAMRNSIEEKASAALNCPREQAVAELERIGNKFDEGYALRRIFEDKVLSLIQAYEQLVPHRAELLSVIIRYFRTPSFLVRFFPLAEKDDEDNVLDKAFASKDDSGLSLEQLINNFFSFLAHRCGEDERGKYLEALKSIQTGEIRIGRKRDEVFLMGEDLPENTLPNVRPVSGNTDMTTRQNLMLTFNTPFYPDVLIATSVMAEGVDLHLNCRYIIHHDLCWNPSTLEQRTGRVDRIGAKVEQCGRPIHIYHPYIAATQDEKMYKVVMDRARWFNILMGEDYEEDLTSTERIACRISLPERVMNQLAFRLDILL